MTITKIVVISTLRQLYPLIQINELANSFTTKDGIHGNLIDLVRVVQLSTTSVGQAIKNYLNKLSHFPSPGTLTRQEALTQIYPRIASLKHDSEAITDDTPRVELCGDLVRVLVLDGPAAVIRLRNHDLAKWQMDEEEAFSVALENLVKLGYEEPTYIDHTVEDGAAVVFQDQDGYTASRLLLPNLWETFSPRLGPEFIAAIPHRDALALMSTQPSLLARLKPKILDDFGRFPRPITPSYIGVCRDGIYPWFSA